MRNIMMASTSVLALLQFVAGGTAVHAEQAAVATAATSDAGLDEIVVTAQRRAESINDVGMAVQAFSGSLLKELRVTSVNDLTTVVPSFTVAQSYQGVPTYTLRGIGFNTINLSATSTVGTYTDEVAYAYPIMNTGPMFDLERVEVLKGPQGTLYGRNTTAGLINFITGKPTKDFEGGVSAELGNYDTYNFEGHVSGPIADGIQARIAFRSENSDKGWQRSNSRDERLGKVDKLGIRGSLALQPTDTTQINASATWWRNKSDTVSGQGVGFTPGTTGSPFNAPGLVDYIAANQPTKATQADWAPESVRSADIGSGLGLPGELREDNTFYSLKLRVDQELTDDIKLVSLTSYSDFKRNALSDWSGAPFEVLVQRVNGHIKSFAQDIHIEGSSDKLNWLVGAYYANDRISDGNRTMLGQNANVALVRFYGAQLLATPFNSGGYTATQMSQAFRTYEDDGQIRTKTWSVFANADYELTEQLKVTGGLRYTEDLQRYVGCSRDFNGNMLPNVNVVNRFLFLQTYGVLAAPITQGQCNSFDPASGSFGAAKSVLDEHNVSWRVALDWTPADGTLLYGSVARGAKAGTTPINAASIARQNAPVRQEMLTAYEVGVKASIGSAMQVNMAAFYYDYKDKQISTYFADPIYTALSRLDNVPKSNAYGIEGDLTWRPVRALTLAANALWLKTKVKDYLGTNAAGKAENFDGASFIYSPEFQGSVSAIVDQPITDSLNLTATANARYQSKSNTIFETLPLYAIPSYTIVNGSLGIKDADDKWSVTLWARNLFDKYHWTAVASNANVVVRFPSPPRTFGATVGVKF